MNEVINRILLAGDKYISKMRLRQPGFTCRPYGPFTVKKKPKNKKRDSRYINKNELDKACSQHGKAYRDFIDLPRRTTDKVL